MVANIAKLATVLSALLLTAAAGAQTLEVPVALQYQTIQRVLQSQLFTAAGSSAEVFSDPWQCNRLALAEPRIRGTDDGHIVLEARLTARGGTPMGGRCLPLFQWQGTMETVQTPAISADGTRLGFEIVESRLKPANPRQTAIPGVLWDWVKAYAHPELARTSVDLRPALASSRALLLNALPGEQVQVDAALNSVGFRSVSVDARQLVVQLGMELPQGEYGLATSDDLFSAAEMAAWDRQWQTWDSFFTWLIKELNHSFAADNPDLSRALATTWLEARYDLRRALAAGAERDSDPVRQLFARAWQRLSALLEEQVGADNADPDLASLQFVAFITAGDALAAADAAAANFNLRFDSATWRALARTLNPEVGADELDYNTAVDPELRALLGLPAQLASEGESAPLPLALLFRQALAATPDAELVKRLNGWVPAPGELDQYLKSVHQLLYHLSTADKARARIPAEFSAIYENLVMATAWQESCWRQYENRAGRITPITSSAGSVGMMQINQHVWRGIYSPDQLQNDVGYNARAGNEILIHYLVDYALRQGEHNQAGGADNLARATYAIYNGGPRHISRYRRDTTSAYLKKIDAAFWKKYRAIQEKGVSAVKSCYGT